MVLDYETMNELQAAETFKTIIYLHSLSEADTAPLIQAFWEGISQPLPTEKEAEKRKDLFLEIGAPLFTPGYLSEERQRMEGSGQAKVDLGETRIVEQALRNEMPVCRQAYTLFAPLKGRHEFGDAAVILGMSDPEEMTELLNGMERVEDLPINAFAHALRAGVCFPLPERIMNIEEMDTLAGRLATNWENLYGALEQIPADSFAGSWQTLLWARALVLAAVQTCSWETCETGMRLVRTFVDVERTFIPAYYAPEVLREGNLYALPGIHRFGWYCTQAFDALEAGDSVGYVRLLRDGLSSCQEMKAMVEFLKENTPELHTENKPSAELLALAEQVRTMLAAYDPEDPAVMALKASPVYQKVSYLIEGDGA